MRRAVRVVLWLAAGVAFVVPLRFAAVATHAYVAGYWATVVDGREEDHFAWRDQDGRLVRGPVEGEPEDGVWDEEGEGTSDITGDRVWVSAEGDAHRVPPPQADMAAGYTGAGVVAAAVGHVLWAGRGSRGRAAGGEFRGAVEHGRPPLRT
ncbi:hypothetical protein [Streptomyces sp. NPDC052225]|uniref:hypothetical protein n=1 Tax=Streptomyces sp. NPDC052225 TaxID=3154949 RepID=UPI00342AC620